MLAFFAFAVSSLGAALWYAASPHQVWFRAPLPTFAARSSALLGAMVAMRAWSEVLSVPAAVIAWLTTTMMMAIVFAYVSAWFACHWPRSKMT